MLQGCVSFVKAARDFFNDRALTLDELKALSTEDRVELRAGLVAEGYDVAELGTVS